MNGLSGALGAYRAMQAAGGLPLAPSDLAASGAAAPAAASDFGTALAQAAAQAIDTGHRTDAMAEQAIRGQGDLTQVVTAVSRAELALQTTVAIRDRVLSAYQDIIKMPI
jgi:flagellar hook-basal body complex protein FliE